MSKNFTGSFTQQEPIPEAGIAAALEVLRHGRLHRYNAAAGEISETALSGAGIRRACRGEILSGGCIRWLCDGDSVARRWGSGQGTRCCPMPLRWRPVPGAIASVGAEPVFVGVTESLTIDLEDLQAKIGQAQVLLLSHMRGHICDMDRLMAICDEADVKVIEDCAHTMGAAWKEVPSGRFGAVGCYSCQTYKHVNSGEGGFLVTDDAEVAARAVMMSGSYMLYERHLAAPPKEAFETIRYETPNISGRMDNLRAAILRPQVADLETQCRRWNDRYYTLEKGLRDTPGLQVIERPEEETIVGSSIQFLLRDWPADAVRDVVARCAARGVELKWFGAPEPVAFTSRYDSWRYAKAAAMPATDRILAGVVDMRVPLTFSLADCALIAEIIRAEVGLVYQKAA